MKRFRKTFFTIILSLIMAFSCLLTAYAENLELDKSAFESFAVSVIGEISVLSDEELDYTAENYKETYPSFAQGILDWKSIKNETGDFVELKSCDVIQNEDGSYKVTADADFTENECTVIIGIGADGYINMLSFESKTAMGSLMKDAFSNLVVGMGTVFLVLIFLCFIISLFKYISIAEKKIADKKADKVETVMAVENVNNKTVAITPLKEAGNEEEIQAVIAAAIAAYEADSECVIEKLPALNNGITVKSYRRN